MVNPFRILILFGIPHEIGDPENLVPVSTAYAMLFLAHTDYFVYFPKQTKLPMVCLKKVPAYGGGADKLNLSNTTTHVQGKKT